jgi:hypothetical protein
MYACSSSGSAGEGRMIVVDDFARRQWKEDYKGLVIKGMSEEALEEKVNELFQKDPGALKDGYAPFCKHLFVPNFLEGALVDAVPITDDNIHKLRTEYQARKPGELAVLTRWFPLGEVQAPPATHLDLIRERTPFFPSHSFLMLSLSSRLHHRENVISFATQFPSFPPTPSSRSLSLSLLISIITQPSHHGEAQS